MAHIRTFRDPHLSRWQSVVDEVFTRPGPPPESVVLMAGTSGAPGPPPAAVVATRDPGQPAADAAATVAAEALVPGGDTSPSAGLEGVILASGLFSTATECARRAFQLVRATLAGTDPATIAQLREDLDDSRCDPRWFQAAIEYIKRFDVDGATIPYRPAPADPSTYAPLALLENATIALVADWATGTDEAFRVMAQIAGHHPDVVIHLGDIYYSGTSHEDQQYFLAACNRLLNRERASGRGIPVFTLAGNHDMYSGGAPYYALIDALNQPPLAPDGQLQSKSFFGLRSSGWQILAMDTGLNDHDAFDAATSMTRLEDLEAAWHRYWIANAGGRRTILLSHHPLFSAFSPIGNEPGADRSTNTALLSQLHDQLPQVDAWFWGHEHNLALYGPWLGLQRGRLIGHGGIPVFASQDPYAARVGDIPVLPPRLDRNDDDVFRHGFVILKLDDAARTAQASYYQDADDRPLLFAETL
jgi:hypothetical protein